MLVICITVTSLNFRSSKLKLKYVGESWAALRSGVGTRYRLKGLGIEYRMGGGGGFRNRTDRPWTHPTSHSKGIAPFHPTPSSAVTEEISGHISTPLWTFMVCSRIKFTSFTSTCERTTETRHYIWNNYISECLLQVEFWASRIWLYGQLYIHVCIRILYVYFMLYVHNLYSFIWTSSRSK